MAVEPDQTKCVILPWLLGNLICWKWGASNYSPFYDNFLFRDCLYVTQMYFIQAMEKKKSESQIVNKAMQMNLLKCISSLFRF